MKVSIDGCGRAKDNIWIERFWKTINNEYFYILLEENCTDLFFGTDAANESRSNLLIMPSGKEEKAIWP